MRKATKKTVSIFGTIAGLAAMEHGVGEMLQGNTTPTGTVILSWPNSKFFSVLGGEPAMTILPNFLITGIVTIILSLIFIIWATNFVQKKYGVLGMAVLAITLLLFGGGFGPPLITTILCLAATKINRPLPSHPGNIRRFIGKLWPWCLVASVVIWLLLMPGLNIISYIFEEIDEILVITTISLSFTSLFLSLISAAAYDSISRSK